MTIDLNRLFLAGSCNGDPCQPPAWYAAMTTPDGTTGVTIALCSPCMQQLIASRAVQENKRTLHLKRIGDSR